jgi:hypothetical protein
MGKVARKQAIAQKIVLRLYYYLEGIRGRRFLALKFNGTCN